MRLSPRTISFCLFATFLAGSTSAQSASVALQKGDEVIGVGIVNDINEGTINDSGEWLVWAGTDNEDQDIDDVLVRNGFLTLQEGTTLGFPSGAKIDAFRSITIDSRGDSGWEFRLRDAPFQYGAYFNTRLVVLEGDPAPAPFTPGSTYFTLNKLARYNDNWQILLLCTVADQSIAGLSEDTLVVLTTDGNGNLSDERVVVYEGGPIAGQTSTVRGLSGNRNSFAINNAGEAMYVVRLNTGSNANDVAIYIDDKLIAQENTNTPISGRRYAQLLGSRVDLNDRGDRVFDATLTGSSSNNSVIFKNGRVFAREANPAPFGIFQSFGSGTPIQLTDDGDVIYYANWSGPTAFDEGVLFNSFPIVQEGITTVNGRLLVDLKNSAETFNISPNGRYLLFLGTVEDQIAGGQAEGAFVVDIGAVERLPGCFGNVPTLARVGGFPVVGGSITLGMDKAQAIGAIPLLLISDGLAPGSAPPCGLVTNLGELLIDFSSPGNPIDAFLGVSWVGAEINITVPIPPIVSLTDVSLYLQGFFFDSLGTTSMPLSLTNALRIEIGAP